MIYKIDWIETKGEGWKVATLIEAIENGKTLTEVSINKTDKKTGQVAFAKFDELQPGAIIEGDYWANPQGKGYLFAPKPKAPAGAPKNNMAGVKAAQERKGEMIEKSQETKARGIQVSCAFRDATLIVVEMLKSDPQLDVKEAHKNIRNWYMKEWEMAEQSLDKPF